MKLTHNIFVTLTSLGLWATRSPSFGLVAQGTCEPLGAAAALLTLWTERPADCFTAELLSVLEDRFTPALLLLLLLAALCSASKRFNICWAGVIWTFFFFAGKRFDFIVCQHSNTYDDIEGLRERTEHLDIFLFSALHSMVFYFRCSVYWWKESIRF